MANVVLKTYAAGDNNQGSVTPQNDALIYQAAVPMNGLFFGGAITLSSANVLHVAAGMGIIGGRFFEVLESDIPVQLSASGDLLGRLYIHLDLSNADNPIEINAVTGASLPALSGDPNLNVSIGAFDMELCTFDINELTISNIVQTFPTITAANNQIRRATAYNVNDLVFCQSASNSLIFVCTTAGTTAVQEPTAYATVTDGNTVTDGTAVFKAVSVSEQITKLSETEVLISNTQNALAIVENGNTCTHTGGISQGQYLCWKGLLYTADSNISVGATFASSGGSKNLTAVTDGGLNDLRNEDILIAESSSANTTWASKLGALQSGYNGLSTYQKRHAYLLISGVVCPCYNLGIFGRIMLTQGSPTLSWFSVVAQQYIRVLFNSDRTFTYNDYSDSASSTNIYLYAPKQ